MSLDTFEQSLLTELRHNVAARTPQRTPRRRWTLAVAAGGLATAGAIATAISLGSGIAAPSGAYAVESAPDGDVVVSIHQLSDPAGLEQALAAKGVDVVISYVPDFKQVDAKSRKTSGGDGAACDIAIAKVDGGLRFTLGAEQIVAGSTLEIITSGSSRTDVGSPVAVSWTGGAC